jgi:hypothetical protein
MATEKKFAGGTDPLVEDQGDGSHIPVIKVRGLGASGALDTTAQATNTSLGTDGASPPTITGTGVRGWLRGIYEKLTRGFCARRAVAVTINTALATPCDALYVGTGGDMTVLTPDGTTAVFKNLQSGTTLGVGASNVTSATAADIVALYY